MRLYPHKRTTIHNLCCDYIIAEVICQPLRLPPLPQALHLPNFFVGEAKVEIVATISSFDLILLSVAIEVFFSANVQSLANFTSPKAVFLSGMLQQSLTRIGEQLPNILFSAQKLFL